ncbi:MAG: hypothetical protein RR263_03850, partial [Oscillospiraceae bacterium]
MLKTGELTFNKLTGGGGNPIAYVHTAKFPKWAIAVIAIPWAYIIVMTVLFSPIFFSNSYRDQLGVAEIKTFDSEIQAIDTSQIPIVDEQLARKLAEKKLGERPSLGSQTMIGIPTIQSVNNKLVWAVPLHHSGFFKWLMNMEGTPGYIIVSATNVNDVDYVEGHKLKYHPTSFLLHDAQRYVRFKEGLFTGLKDYSFELDDNGVPYWVITTYKNRIGFNLPEATGAILLNATTGETTKHTIDDIPKWVDRVQPEDFVVHQINNQGEFVHGIFNFSNKDKFQTSAGHNIVYNNGDCYLFTGLTSVGADESALGFIMVDMVTKQSHRYQFSGATELAAMRSAEGKVQNLRYSATFPIILNIANQPTYFMTLKDDEGLIKQYAMVSVVNYSSVGTGETMQAAIQDYQKSLKNDGLSNDIGATVENKSITGVVARIAPEVNENNTVYKLILEEDLSKIFVVEAAASDELALTQIGDKVSVSYIESGDGVKMATEFDNVQFKQEAS